MGLKVHLRGGPLEITGRGGKFFQWMNFFFFFFFFFSANCLHEFFFFFNVKALHDFSFDSPSFNVKEMQSFAQPRSQGFSPPRRGWAPILLSAEKSPGNEVELRTVIFFIFIFFEG